MVGSLVGRDEELTTLVSVLDAAAGGPGAFAAVTGPAGIGKTRLADAVAAAATDRGFEVVWGSCWDGPGAPALWPWTQVVRALTGGDLPGAPTGFALYDAVVRLVLDRTTLSPLLVVIDDLQHADAASLHVLDLLVRQRRGSRVAILVTRRSPGSASTIERSTKEAVTVELRGLPREAIARLAAGAGAAVSVEQAARLHDATGGNPFFVLELARQLAGADPGGELPVPPNVLDVLRDHLATVPDGCRQVLAAAAVQGRSFDIRTVAAACGLAESAVQAQLVVAAGAGLLSTVPPHDRFAHALIVEAVRRELEPVELRRLHLAVAGALDDPESIAAHLAAAGDLVTADDLITACRRAAGAASARFAPAAAADHLGAALAVCADGATRVDLLVELCDAHKAARDLVGARRAALDAAGLARAAGDAAGLARAALAMPPDAEGIEVDRLADPEQLALREEALASVPRQDDLAARLMAALALSLYWAQRTGDRALDHQATALRRDQLTATAVELARRSGDPAALAACIGSRLYALWGPDAPADRRSLTDELLDLAEQAGDGAVRLEALGWLVVDALQAGDHRRAVAAVADYTRLAEARRDPMARWAARRWQASLAILEGRLDDGAAVAADALALGTDAVGEDSALLFYLVAVGLVSYLRGELGEALATVQATADDPGNVPAWRCGLVLAAVEAGELDLARRELHVLAADDFAALPRDLDWLSSLVALAPAVRALDDHRVAQTLLHLLAPHADEHALVGLGYVSYGPVRRAIALAHAATGDLDRAAAELRTALDRLDPGLASLVDLCRRDLEQVQARLSGPAGTAMLRPDGGQWLVAGPDTDSPRAIRHRRGLAVLRELVAAPGEIAALELLWLVEPPDDTDPALRAVVAARRTEPVLDAEARRAFRRRMEELRAELDAADRAGDAQRSAAAADELERLEDELRRLTGPDGRSRRSPDAAERARTSVTKLLRRAIAAITEVDAGLGAHLDRSVRTGTVCAYEPRPGDRLRWDLGR